MKELFELGFWEGFFAFDIQPLNGIVWACLLVGFLIQYLVLQLAKRPYIKWIFPALLLSGITVCEFQTWVITGWDLFGVCVIYWGIVCLAIGAGLAWVVCRIQTWRKKGGNHEKTDPSL